MMHHSNADHHIEETVPKVQMQDVLNSHLVTTVVRNIDEVCTAIRSDAHEILIAAEILSVATAYPQHKSTKHNAMQLSTNRGCAVFSTTWDQKNKYLPISPTRVPVGNSCASG
jgi:hypothetical protein